MPSIATSTTMTASETLSLAEEGIQVSLHASPLVPQTVLDGIRDADAGANILFSGTTRRTTSHVQSKTAYLSYTAYTQLALKTLLSIARSLLHDTHGRNGDSVKKIVIQHRLGTVPVGQESILVGVSAGHRALAWQVAESCLEQVKARAEIWKTEHYEDASTAQT